MSDRRIVVTGMGTVSPLGCGTEAVWERLLAGRSGLGELPAAIVGDLPAKVGGVVPDLRYMSAQTRAEFDAIALGGLRHQKGMIGFANVMGHDVLAKPDTDAIHAYLTKRAHDLLAEQQAAAR